MAYRYFPRWRGSLALPLTLVLVAVGAAQSQIREPEAFLKKYIHFSPADLAAMKRGEVVAKLVDTTNKRELAISGVVRLNVPKEYFAARVRDIEEYKKSENVLRIGKFSKPPRLEDLADLTIDAGDLTALKNCKVGKCGLKLPAEQIERVRAEVDWSRPDAGKTATDLFRRVLLEYVNAYLAGGTRALAEYHDRKNALNLAAEFRSLVAASPYLAEYAPDFQAYLEQYPEGRLDDVEDFIYWSKEVFGLKPVISITHVTIHTITRAGATHVLISSKQIYASHYFDSSFALTVFVEEIGGGPQPSSYLIYLNRSRTDQLGGMFSGITRSIVEGRMLGGVRKNLRSTKERLETAYARPNGRPPKHPQP